MPSCVPPNQTQAEIAVGQRHDIGGVVLHAGRRQEGVEPVRDRRGGRPGRTAASRRRSDVEVMRSLAMMMIDVEESVRQYIWLRRCGDGRSASSS